MICHVRRTLFTRRPSLAALACALGVAVAFTLTASHSRASIAIIGSLDRQHPVFAGGAFGGDIMIRNVGTKQAIVKLSQADYSFSADGSNQFPSPGTLKRSNASWVMLDNTLVQIAAGETATVHYSGRVPDSVSGIGSFWSLILVQEASGVFTSPNVETVTRYGIQVVTDLGSSARRSVKFAKKQVVGEAKAKALQFDLENDGECLIFPQISAEVFSSDGTRVGRFETKASRLYPECSSRSRVELTGIPSGTYQAVVYVDCGDDQIIGMRCEIAL